MPICVLSSRDMQYAINSLSLEASQFFESPQSHIEKTSSNLSLSSGVLLPPPYVLVSWDSLLPLALCPQRGASNNYNIRISFIACMCMHQSHQAICGSVCCITRTQGKVLNEVLWRKSHVHISGGGKKMCGYWGHASDHLSQKLLIWTRK